MCRILPAAAVVGAAIAVDSAFTAVVLYPDHGEWTRNSSITQPVATSAGGMLHAFQVVEPPAPGTALGATLDFSDCLDANAVFSLSALQRSAALVFGDGGSSAFGDALSVGAAGVHTDDDLRFDFPASVPGGNGTYAFGFTLRDNEAARGETVTVGGIGDVVLGVFPLPHCPGTSAFIGIVADDPVAWIRIDESPDGDDIAVGDFEIGSQFPPLIHYGLPADDWAIHVGAFETLETHAETLGLAEELGARPTADAPIGPTLTLAKHSPLTRSIRLTVLEEGGSWVHDDADGNGEVGLGFADALSAGERGVSMHDSWQLEILDGPPVDAVGFDLGDSDDGDGECIEVFTTKGTLIATITPMPKDKGGKAFIGLHAHEGDAIGRVVFHESPDSDDISVAEIRFAPAGKECVGDIDEDGAVDGADIGELLSHWGPCEKKHCHEDLNKDGGVDSADLALLLEAWGSCER